ncbi:hypothetical protein [Eubacterium pyruvativorans]|uniref:hypothetical protein n=1 Tax=Eubacterium pyruvativorans TaxID=155865 RepID=UPI001566B095|nr:hypothetical protein [Eubacterium pyruvativorans]
MRVFISQPMNGKTYSEIKNERKKAIEAVRKEYPDEEIKIIDNLLEEDAVRKEYPDEEIKIIDNLLEEDYEIANPMWCLGNSIELLSTADVAYFADGWNNARGCRIEFICAYEYGIKFITVM